MKMSGTTFEAWKIWGNITWFPLSILFVYFFEHSICMDIVLKLMQRHILFLQICPMSLFIPISNVCFTLEMGGSSFVRVSQQKTSALSLVILHLSMSKETPKQRNQLASSAWNFYWIFFHYSISISEFLSIYSP